jgi:membrane dipeptidase
MFQLVETKDNLDSLVTNWKDRSVDSNGGQTVPTGIIISIEGAECVRNPAELAEWQQRGVRLIGPAWAGNRYCGGTDEPGPLTSEGFGLLEAMADFGFILDLSHMDEQAALQALDFYPGQIVATHSNAASLLKNYEGNRHLSDHVIKKIIERGGVIGVIPFNKFLLNGWKVQDGRDIVTLEHFTAHIDYICQIAGSSENAAIGSDFDGGFGLQSVPSGINSIADLHKITPILVEKGYTDSDIGAILANNWFRKIKNSLPDVI